MPAKTRSQKLSEGEEVVVNNNMSLGQRGQVAFDTLTRCLRHFPSVPVPPVRITKRITRSGVAYAIKRQ